MYTGVIEDFSGGWNSGIAILSLTDGVHIPCENGPTVRALEEAYPGFIGEGHTVNVDVIRGKEIAYQMTDYGLMSGFIPVEELSEYLP